MLPLVEHMAPGSAAELEAFAALQAGLGQWFTSYMEDPDGDHALVVVPSMTFDRELLEKVAGVDHYEERLLAMLTALRRPRLRLVYCTSTPVSPAIVDYYLQMISGVPQHHSRHRLTLISCDDASPRPLTEKLLERPHRLAEATAAIAGASSSVMFCQNSTGLERSLAVRLGVPLYANPPELDALGSKSGSREIFRAAGVDMPEGRERLRDMDDVAHAIAELLALRPGLRRAVVKLEEGFSGEGNAVLDLHCIDATTQAARAAQVAAALPGALRFVADITYEEFAAKFAAMGGVVEEFLEGSNVRSPSAQAAITPDGAVRALSTHDQILGGADGQVFEGSTFPADAGYRLEIQDSGVAVGHELRARGAMGRYAVDFMVLDTPQGRRTAAIEINLRRGGTTHPMMALEILTNGAYDDRSGQFVTGTGRVRSYCSTDNRKRIEYRQLSIEDFMDLMVTNHLNYDPVTETGAVFHMLGALSEYGKFGMTCIAEDLPAAYRIDEAVTAVLDEACDPVD
jgi:hypothetical protein